MNDPFRPRVGDHVTELLDWGGQLYRRHGRVVRTPAGHHAPLFGDCEPVTLAQNTKNAQKVSLNRSGAVDPL